MPLLPCRRRRRRLVCLSLVRRWQGSRVWGFGFALCLSLSRDLEAQAGTGFISFCTTASPVILRPSPSVVAAPRHLLLPLLIVGLGFGLNGEQRGSGDQRGGRVLSSEWPSHAPLRFFVYLPLVFLIYYFKPKDPKINGNIQFTFSLVLYQDNSLIKYINLTFLCSNIILINK